ncbi:uncharacterized protein PG986_003593 [Apiospora aurea]|uniref:Uncharacterized protein n=1 Tax=Apiospora aurea TaxID=335848 RepID=A0ABR1QS42_9PEZI
MGPYDTDFWEQQYFGLRSHSLKFRAIGAKIDCRQYLVEDAPIELEAGGPSPGPTRSTRSPRPPRLAGRRARQRPKPKPGTTPHAPGGAGLVVPYERAESAVANAAIPDDATTAKSTSPCQSAPRGSVHPDQRTEERY